MVIVGAADLHLSAETLEEPERLRKRASAVCAEALIIGGDLTAGPLTRHAAALAALQAFAGPRLFVCGNHDLWQGTRGRNTWQRYDRDLAEVTAAAGFHYLEAAPLVIGAYGFVGAMGWYDYTTRQLQPPEGEARLSPATLSSPKSSFRTDPARQNLRWDELEPDDYRTKALQCQDDNVLQGLVWNDGFYTDWGRSDEEMVRYFCDKLERQAAEVATEVDHIVAVTHFVPFAEVLPVAKTVTGAYIRAFAGSTKLGETIRALPKVRAALFGHWHQRCVCEVGGLTAANITVNHGKERPLRLEV